MTIQQAVDAIRPVDQSAMAAARTRWDDVLKPTGSLGKLEDHLARMAGITGSADVATSPKAVAVFCADNGVVAQGHVGMDPSLTAQVAVNLTKGDTCVCHMARLSGAAVFPVDVGIASDVSAPGLRVCKTARGTRDFTREHAMAREQAVSAVEAGIGMARELAGKGYRLLAAGEMGIGNTTTSAAVAAVLLDRPARATTGRGSGLSDASLAEKVRLIDAAIGRWRPDPSDPLDVLCKVGGFDLAAMAGFYLGAAACRTPVVLDGVISCAAALLAVGLQPLTRAYLLPSHLPAEPAGRLILERLDLSPLLAADMRLGEGTGAVATFPLYDMAAEIYHNMPTFSGTGNRPRLEGQA